MIYCVRVGRQTGKFNTWDEVKPLIEGYSGAEYKKVKSDEEANIYLNGGSVKGKYVYAVKETGDIFESWEDCSAVVKGNNYKYKKFKTKEEANAWLRDEDSLERIMNSNIPTVYVDGSYKDGQASFGVVFVYNGDKIVYKGKVDGVQRNISGKIGGIAFAVHLIVKLGYNKANIVYDSEHLFAWFAGTYKANSMESRRYVQFMRRFVAENNLELFWYKVKSHSGNLYNNEANKAAKQAFDNANTYVLKDLFSVNKDLSI